MRALNTSDVETSNGSEYTPLPTDTYEMKIIKAWYAKSQRYFNKDGTPQEQLLTVWELVTPHKDPENPDIQYKDRVTEYMSSWFGTSTSSGDSALKKRIDSLQKQGLIGDVINIAEDEAQAGEGTLIGIRQRVMVEETTNKEGKPINKVVTVAPLKPAKPKAAPTDTTPTVDQATLDHMMEQAHEPGITAEGLASIAAEMAKHASTYYQRRDFAKLDEKTIFKALNAMYDEILNPEPELSF